MTSESVILINQRHEVAGTLIEFKDELMRIQVTEEHEVELTEFILALYKGKQIEAKVIIVKPGEIGLFIPLLPDDYFNDRRNFPRIRVDLPAILIQQSKYEERIVRIRLHDVSHRGFSFIAENDEEIEQGMLSRMVIQSEQLPVVCDIVVTNQVEQAGHLRYGSRIQFMDNSNIRILYGYMLAKQV